MTKNIDISAVKERWNGSWVGPAPTEIRRLVQEIEKLTLVVEAIQLLGAHSQRTNEGLVVPEEYADLLFSMAYRYDKPVKPGESSASIALRERLAALLRPLPRFSLRPTDTDVTNPTGTAPDGSIRDMLPANTPLSDPRQDAND